MYKPKLEIRKYCDEKDEDGMYSYAVFRLDKISPIIKGISHKHAEHIMKILLKMPELPEHIEPIKDWYNFDYIVDT